MVMVEPIFTQQFQGALRHRNIAVAVSFSSTDVSGTTPNYLPLLMLN
jgi:hypothetical protein